MKICKACGVELEDDMNSCPLCDTAIANRDKLNIKHRVQPEAKTRHLMQRILWQITVVLLLSGIVATLAINLSIVGKITWSVYPISICLMILSYASLVALWRTRLIFQILGGWFISASILVTINQYFHGDWPLLLALPILSALNVIGICLYFFLVNLKTKGLNVLTLIFVSFAIASLAIEAIISLYFTGETTFGWSIIVAACLLPVTAAILFMYFRTRNNSDIQKIFHT